MASIIIQSDNSENLDLLSKLAEKMGDYVSGLSEEQFEDMILAKVIDQVKTRETVSRESIMEKLDN